jgi:uncharacterized membrane protein YdfJ with MMPL/SSD domain
MSREASCPRPVWPLERVLFALACTVTLVSVLLDAALVRLVPVPVMLRLPGRWAWWLPTPLHRLLPDVRFGHASSRGATTTPQEG